MASNAPQSKYSDYQFLVAYLTFFLLMAWLVRSSRFMYVTTYYFLSLFCIFLVLSNPNVISTLLAPLANTPTG